MISYPLATFMASWQLIANQAVLFSQQSPLEIFVSFCNLDDLEV